MSVEMKLGISDTTIICTLSADLIWHLTERQNVHLAQICFLSIAKCLAPVAEATHATGQSGKQKL